MVSRLCAPIEGTDAARLADCLGLDAAKYRGSASGEATADELREEALLASAASLDDDALYKVWHTPLKAVVCVALRDRALSK